uniref:Integrase zinc-binding domain-containing protein n=1 Tax=Tanacetum cinerariifolium TaxID=118510 RepID=A0A6L2P514_TANCI|nr:hypothetical protein [Tanacetum cinerariifolium]
MRFDVPKFTREELEKCRGVVYVMSKNGLITDWERFKESVMNRFRPSKYEDPQGALSKLLQLSTVEEYQVAKPTTLGDAFSLARVTEARLDDQATSVSVTTTKDVTSSGGNVSRTLGNIGSGNVHVLIDNGSTHSFVWPDVMEKMCLPVQSSKPFKVCIESGETLLCERPDVVLGIKWLQKLRKVTHDYAQQTMEFSLANTTYSLKGDESLRMKRISLHHMKALLEADDIYGVYEVHSFSMVTEGITRSTEMTESISPEIEQLLVQFSSLFQKQGFQWGDIENKAFQDLKARLSEALILGLLSFEDMFTVEADASDVGFDFAIEYKTGTMNVVADVLSHVYDEADEVIVAFMALSQPLVSLVDNLRNENETLDELKIIHQKLERKEVLDGFRQEQGMILFCDRYFIGVECKLKELLLSKFHNTSMIGHSGVKKILVGMSTLFYWKRMRKSIEDSIRYGRTCQCTLLRVYRYFRPLPASFNAPKKQLFKASGTKLNHSTAYHPQTDRQTEVVNRGLEQYLRAMVSDRPQHWAMYGHLPPLIIPYPSGSTKVADVEELLIERDVLLRQLKQSLAQAKNRIVMQANRKHHEVEYKIGDMTAMVDFVPGRAVTEAAQCKRVKYEAKCVDIG